MGRIGRINGLAYPAYLCKITAVLREAGLHPFPNCDRNFITLLFFYSYKVIRNRTFSNNQYHFSVVPVWKRSQPGSPRAGILLKATDEYPAHPAYLC